ncbi:MAG: MMPL family transporter [Nocardioidaceae bacterium]
MVDLDGTATRARTDRPPTRLGGVLRRTKWAVVALWLVAAVCGTMLASHLGDVERDDSAAFLPADLQSTQVAALLEHAPEGQTSSAIMVFDRSGEALTREDSGVIDDRRRQLSREFGSEAVSKPVVADDGKAAVVVVSGISDDQEADAVASMRESVSAGSQASQSTQSTQSSLQARVTGEAALDADNDAGDVDALLLLTSMLIVAVLLVLTYRSPVLWLVPLVCAVVAVQVARGAVYLEGRGGLTVTDLSSAIVIVLVFGAATDYALLLLNRYREELAHYDDRHDAAAVALRRTLPALAASAGTVVVGMLCLLVASLAGISGLGPIAATGVAVAFLAMVTLLPAVLLCTGRWVLWPRTPSPQHPERAGRHRLWSRVAGVALGRPAVVTVAVSLLLLLCCTALGGLRVSADPLDKAPPGTESVAAYHTFEDHFPVGMVAPVTVVLPSGVSAGAAGSVRDDVSGVPHVVRVADGPALPGHPRSLEVTMDVSPYGETAESAISSIRRVVDIGAPGSLVGGLPVQQLDYRDAALRDTAVIAPMLLLTVSLIIGLLLRSVVAALVVLGTVVLSLLASFGVSLLLFDQLMGFGPVAADLFVYVLVFLVALGVDYNIFLMERIREERRRRTTREAVRHGLTVTGGVITAAGLVLAGTFVTLAQLPDVTVAEVGLAVAVGVLMDTLIVRSLLVPALVAMLGDRAWWPSRRMRHG